MSDLFWLSDKQLRRISPFFPLAHGVARIDDRRVIQGSFLCCAMAFAGVMLLGSMDLTRPCT